MKRKILTAFSFIIAFLLINVISVKANDNGNVYALGGASIRLKGVQGLRFNAKLDSSVKNNEHGFYLVYGQVLINEFKTLVDNNNVNELMVNDKQVFRVLVEGVNKNNEFSVVLTGIPDQGYFDELTAIPFVKIGSEEKLADNPSRSVAVVAMKMANLGYDISMIESLSSINDTSKMRVLFNKNGVIEIKKGVFEADRVKLKEQFVSDWKTKTGDDFENMSCEEFFDSATKGLNNPGSPYYLSSNTDLTGGNLYEFFNDNKFINKWSWLLDYLKGMNNDNVKDIDRQVNAIYGNGVSLEPLSRGLHLSYSIANFFNADNKGGIQTAVLFAENSYLYDFIDDYNRSIYADPDDTVFVDVGDELDLPELEAQEGYAAYYYKDDEKLNGKIIVPGVNTVIEPKLEPVDYYLQLMDGDYEIANIKLIYNVYLEFILPTPSKAGYEFLGWYENKNLSGDLVTQVNQGLVGNKVFYSKWKQIEQVDPNQTYTITYVLNGGALDLAVSSGYQNRDQMITDFLTDFYNFLADNGHLNKASVSLNTFMHGEGKTSGFDGVYNIYEDQAFTYGQYLLNINDKTVNPSTGRFINQPEYNKWVPLLDLVCEYTTAVNPEQTGWASPYTMCSRIKPFFRKQITWQNADETIITEIVNRIPEDLQSGEAVEAPSSYKISSPDITLPNVIKEGYNFLGWYDNANFQGSPITKIVSGSHGDVTLYARYESSGVVDPEPEKVTVTFNLAGGTGNAPTQTINKGAKAVKPADPTRSGYTFDGWYLNNVKYNFNNNVENNITLTAKWNQPNYTITYNLNGGSFVGYNNKNELAVGFFTDLHRFLGSPGSLNDFMHGAGNASGYEGTWYHTEEFQGKIYAANVKTGNNDYFASHSSYQHWKPFFEMMEQFVNTVNPDQHFWDSPYTGNMRIKDYFQNEKYDPEVQAMMPNGLSANVIYEYSENTPTINLPNVIRDGHKFLGWFTANEGGQKVTNIPTGSSGNKAFYARWEEEIVDIVIDGTKTLYGNDLWAMVDLNASDNLLVTDDSIKAEFNSRNGVYQSRAIKINEFEQLVPSWTVFGLENEEICFQFSIGNGQHFSEFMQVASWKRNNFRSSTGYDNPFASLSHDTFTNKSKSHNIWIKIRFVIINNGSHTARVKNVSVTTKRSPVYNSSFLFNTEVLNMPAENQLSIPGIGNSICSPTSLSMILRKHGKNVNASSVAAAVKDQRSGIYGNWTFNASYAGSHWLSGRVEYIDNIVKINNYNKDGLPIAVSITTATQGELQNSPSAYPVGHLIVVIGFINRNGTWYAIVHDPAVHNDSQVRREYRVDQLIAAMSGYAYVVTPNRLS